MNYTMRTILGMILILPALIFVAVGIWLIGGWEGVIFISVIISGVIGFGLLSP